MTITPLAHAGNSSKFTVRTKNGEFIIAISYTLKKNIWVLAGESNELTAAEDLAQAIVSRHDPSLPFPKIYIFAEHNSLPVLAEQIAEIRKIGRN